MIFIYFFFFSGRDTLPRESCGGQRRKALKTLPRLGSFTMQLLQLPPQRHPKACQGASPGGAVFPRSTKGWRLVFCGDGKVGRGIPNEENIRTKRQ